MSRPVTEDNEKSQSLSNRRGFMKTAGLAGAGSLAAGAAASAKSISKKKERKIRVGAIGITSFSFWTYSWGDLLAPDKPIYQQTLGTDVLNMEVTHAWDVNPEGSRKFADTIGAKLVKRYDDMVGKVDAVAFGGWYDVPWQHKLARPYIEAGIPTFLSRPFAYSLRDVDDILDLVAKHNTPIIATDVYEHLYDTTTLKGRLKHVGEIGSVHGTCLAGEYPGRFHVQFMILKILGYDVEKISLITDNPNKSSYIVETMLFKGWEGQPAFPCCMSMSAAGDLYSFTVSGKNGIETARLPQFSDWRFDLQIHHLPQLIAMQRTFEGENYESLDLVRKKTEIFLTGFYSSEERGGAPVDVGTVPMDWRPPYPKPGWIDESIFR